MAENQLGQVVNVTVSLDTAPLSPAAFGRAAIFGPNAAAVGTTYTSLSGMTADGIATTDQEYVEAAALLAQSSETGRKVSDWLVGQRSTAVAQIDTGTVTYDASSTYSITLSGKGIASVTVGPVAANTDADTTATDIASAIDGSSFGARVNCAGTGGSTGEYTVTSAQAGIPFTMTVTVTGGAGTHVSTTSTANNGIAEDLDAAVAAGHQWYLTTMVSRDAREIVEAAAWHESASPAKIFIAQHSQAASLTGVYDAASPYADLPSELKALGYNRTATLYHATDSAGAAAAWAGARLPFDPGTQTWSHKTLIGITADALTSAQVGILAGTATLPASGKNANCYIPYNDTTSRVLRGMMASGRRIDEQRTLDMVQNGLETVGANVLLGSNKIPLTNPGAARVVAPMEAYLMGLQSGENSALDPDVPIESTVPDVGAMTSSERANRALPAVSFTGRLSGAIEHFTANVVLAN